MDIHTARLIREIKKGCTFRKLAEIYYEKGDINYGNQLSGDELCREALAVLYPDENIRAMYKPEEKFGYSFLKENRSYIGDFYWWE